MHEKEFDLFLSYSRNSIILAEKISNELEKYGLFVWFDRTDVILGSEIKYNLMYTLDAARHWLGIILLFDETYFSKEWCIHELELSLKNKITLFPILYGMEKATIPSKYSTLKDINMVTIRKQDDFDYAINKILSAIISKNPPTETVNLHSEIFQTLVKSYNCLTRAESERVICADNIARFLECAIFDKLTHYDLFLTKVIHNKCSKLFQLDSLSNYDIKVVCDANNMLLRKIKQI